MASKQDKERERLWLKMYGQLVKFKSVHGHARVPSTWRDATLAKWVARQRKNEDAMPSVRKKKLEAIGFSWHGDIRERDDQLWETKFQQLKAFHREHGHYRVPSTDADLHSLRIWVDIQRRKENTLPPDRKKKLDAIGFRWRKKIKTEVTRQWNVMYEQLQAYRQKHGDCRVPKHSEKYKQLCRWVQHNRKRWDKLDRKQRKKLEGIGFIPSSLIEKEKRQKWLTMLSMLKRFKKQHGHCLVPNRFEGNPELGRWVAVQRLDEKHDRMLPWRKEKLDELGFAWSDAILRENEKKWYAMYDKLERFHKRFGHSAVPEYWKEDPQLSIWVAYQRKPKKPLSSDKINLLKLVKFLWKPTGRRRSRDKQGRFAMELGS